MSEGKETKTDKVNFNPTEKFFVEKAMAYYEAKFNKLTAKEKQDPFTIKTVIEYYHDKQPMSPMLHDLKKRVFAKLDEMAGKKVKTFNELYAEEQKLIRQREVQAEKDRVQALRHAQAEKERLPFLSPGKTTFMGSKDGSKSKAKKKTEVEKPFKMGVKPNDELKFTINDLED